jgi:hypothetical protein
MSIQPQGDPIRKAVKWISAMRLTEPADNLERLVEQAAVEFNLSPKDVEFLRKLVAEKL